ncbi:MAG TPA: decarboxylating 6-phosphogluconate dehydrogenase [Phycisphaerae bacterium]|nr:decarboxylating 6-phosphogluconate dehydrogenase [Phycisphaerae bacterium]
MAETLTVGLIGLGRMGLGIAGRLIQGGHSVVAYDRDGNARCAAATAAARTVDRVADLAPSLPAPRVVWLMIPAGPAVDAVLFDGPDALAASLGAGDVVIDGGNSHHGDSRRRAERLASSCGAAYLDCGTSGGVEGARIGYCLMVGGPAEAYRRVEPALRSVATPGGCAYVGPSGAGHFVKMVHNAIEYGLLQVIGEGMSMLDRSPYGTSPAQAAALWTHGSVIRSWLMELAATALSRPNHFERIAPQAGGGQTGAWAVEAAAQLGVKTPAIALSLAERGETPANAYAARMVAALRYEFGRHAFETVREPSAQEDLA